MTEFADGYTYLKEMGFSSNSSADALLMNDNDRNKAIQHLLNNPSCCGAIISHINSAIVNVFIIVLILLYSNLYK